MPEFDSTLEFRDVVGFPGYKVGNDGTIWSCWKRIGGGDNYGSSHVVGTVWKQLKLHQTKSGHLRVHLCPGRRKRQVHHLVLLAFVGACPDGMECCHFPDRNPANNRLNNLRWDTKRENYNDRDKHGTTAKGERNGMAKLSADLVRNIRREFYAGATTKKALANRYGVTEGAIYCIIKRRTWKHVV